LRFQALKGWEIVENTARLCSPATELASTSPGCATSRSRDVDNLPLPEVIAQEIVEDLEAALAEFAAISDSLSEATPDPDSRDS
jgi:hypothetical protein